MVQQLITFEKHQNLFVKVIMMVSVNSINLGALLITVQHKILMGENIDEFDEFPAIRQ